MERSLLDDFKAGFAVLLGAAVGYLLVGADDPGLLLGGVIGVVAVTVVLNVVRRLWRRPKT